MSSVPNLITLARLLMVPVIAVLLANHQYAAAFWLFLAVGFSDGLDGFIARRYNATSAAGALLDPVADKMSIITCAFVLAWNGVLPHWLAIPLIGRDVLMLGVGMTDPRLKKGWLPPNRLGKTHAALAFATLSIAIAQAAPLFDVGVFLLPLFVLLFVSTVASGLRYFLAWRRARHEAREGASKP